MKKSIPTIFISLLLTVICILPGHLFAGNETKWTAPVQITIDESLFDSQPAIIHLHVQVEKPEGSKYFTVLPVQENEFIEMTNTNRTGGMKDGKIDVDIIIRYQDMLAQTKENPYVNLSSVRIVAFKIEFITVDNISGVVVSNEIPDMNMGGARVTGISFDNGAERPAPIETAITFGKVSPSGTAVSENASTQNNTPAAISLRLFPIPVRDGMLNVEIPSDLNVRSLTIHNALGAKVRSINMGTMPALVTIPVQDLESGIYFLRLQTTDSRQEIVKRFLIRN